VPEAPAPVQGTTPEDRGSDVDVPGLESRRLEPKRVSEPPSPPGPVASARQFALFVALVLAVTSVVEVATGSRASSQASRPRWPDPRARAGFVGG
jgi:hypothetical protein